MHMRKVERSLRDDARKRNRRCGVMWSPPQHACLPGQLCAHKFEAYLLFQARVPVTGSDAT